MIGCNIQSNVIKKIVVVSMPRGGYREGAGRKKSQNKKESDVIRVPVERLYLCKVVSRMNALEYALLRNYLESKGVV